MAILQLDKLVAHQCPRREVLAVEHERALEVGDSFGVIRARRIVIAFRELTIGIECARLTDQAAHFCPVRVYLGVLVRQLPQLRLFVHDIQHVRVNVHLLHPERVGSLHGIKFAFGRFEVYELSRIAAGQSTRYSPRM